MRSLYEAPLHSPSSISIRQLDLMSNLGMSYSVTDGLDVGCMHSASRFFESHYFELFRVHVNHTGRVRWWIGGIMDTSCGLDVTLFPFDSQSCSIVVRSWAHSEAHVDLRNASNIVHLERFNDDGVILYKKLSYRLETGRQQCVFLCS